MASCAKVAMTEGRNACQLQRLGASSSKLCSSSGSCCTMPAKGGMQYRSLCTGYIPGKNSISLCEPLQDGIMPKLKGLKQLQHQPSRQARAFSQRSAGSSRGQATALFTGIVEELGTVRELKDVSGTWELTVEASVVLEDVKLGDSIAVNGTCLTVTRFTPDTFVVGLSPETLRRTSLGEVSAQSKVNLERSLQPSSRMGGHFVQGHVDGTGTITAFRPDGDSLWVTIKTSPEIIRYIVPKGYIAVDGTSLTVVDVFQEDASFTFMLVAYTQTKIVVPLKKIGDKVNLEVDIVGKYVERFLDGYKK